MKKNISCVLLALLVTSSSCSQNVSRIADYLNQPEPGDVPEIFAPGLVSIENANEYPPSFSADMSEMYFGYNWKNGDRYIMHTKRDKDGRWSKPEKVSFTGFPEAESILSPDNSKIFFAAHTDAAKRKPHDLWYANRHKDGWGKPIKLGKRINTDKYEYFATSTNAGKIYFSREGEILFADSKNDKHSEVQLIDPEISGMKFVSHPFIAPDEGYLIFDSREPDGYGSADLYISFRKNGRWGKPINLGSKINTPKWDAMPIVTPDGKYLFFCREAKRKRDVYWVKFDIEKYRKR